MSGGQGAAAAGAQLVLAGQQAHARWLVQAHAAGVIWVGLQLVCKAAVAAAAAERRVRQGGSSGVLVLLASRGVNLCQRQVPAALPCWCSAARRPSLYRVMHWQHADMKQHSVSW